MNQKNYIESWIQAWTLLTCAKPGACLRHSTAGKKIMQTMCNSDLLNKCLFKKTYLISDGLKSKKDESRKVYHFFFGSLAFRKYLNVYITIKLLHKHENERKILKWISRKGKEKMSFMQPSEIENGSLKSRGKLSAPDPKNNWIESVEVFFILERQNRWTVNFYLQKREFSWNPILPGETHFEHEMKLIKLIEDKSLHMHFERSLNWNKHKL